MDSLVVTSTIGASMALNVSKSTPMFLCDTIINDELSTLETAEVAGCSDCAITWIRPDLRLYGSVKAFPVKAGRPRSTASIMLETLCHHLLEKPRFIRMS